jgi:hypothetical protein
MTFHIRSLHEPISRSGASVYTALCTVVQAFPLAVILWVLGRADVYDKTISAIEAGQWATIPWDIILRILLAVAVIAVVWHRYVLDNNFMAWRLTGIDTAIPFFFAFVQCFLALSTTSTIYFSFFFALITASGSLSYWHAKYRLASPHACAMFQSHFGTPEGDEIYRVIQKYFDDSYRKLRWSTVASAIVFFVCAAGTLSRARNLDLLMLLVVSGYIVGLHFVDDSANRLKEYFNRLPGETPPHATATDQRAPVKIAG